MDHTIGNRIIALIANHRMSDEADVNGVWNTILNLYFPANQLQFTISPEASPGGNSRTDLLIRHFNYAANNLTVDNSFAVLLFEGKREGGDTFDQIRAQLRGYFDHSGFATCWAVGARGTRVKFWRYVRSRMEDKMRPWRVSSTGVPQEVTTDSGDLYTFEITDWNGHDSTKSFVPIIDYMRAHPQAPAT